ncbi:2-succinyl-6-hydroxy-2,4-cyclohexadiene-1-carboxylate synthase [Ureibacillus terrenus]|uniref:2-succinyl-6-hydroxy-2, 4-cyclohexadiene-1-carboxylate synthase n=1 Tax=Ureibacillus terrenus TaxID=118246 RepID=UPI002E1EC069|nr:2-succinyl-6-hydroxy-2,4-cyclohexadiene-1-carboxylate synthase [Ureibacillus terrenus]
MAALTVRGIQVNVEIWNEHGKETLVLLHGFTGSTKTWQRVIGLLPKTIKIVAIDLLGHGKTDAPKDPSRYKMTEQVKDLEEIFDRLRLQDFTLLGYSMGGRTALSYAVHYPNRIKRLILESASPGLRTEEERAARRRSDESLANEIEEKGIHWFVDKWENITLFASQKTLPAEIRQAIREERLSQSETGLANSLRGMGTGAQDSNWPKLNQLSIPVVLITGELDQKFVQITKQMAEQLPNAKHITVPDAGHSIHVENPEQFATIVKGVL